MKERGYATYMLICPVCQRTYEKLTGDEFPTRCLACSDVVCVPWVQYTAEKKMAEIDLMPLGIFRKYIQRLGFEMIKRNNINEAKCLAMAVLLLDELKVIEWQDKSFTVAQLQGIFSRE